MPFKIQVAAVDPRKLAVDLLAVPVALGASVKDEPLAPLDKALNGALGKQIERDDYKGKRDQQLDVATLGHLEAGRLLILGTGSDEPSSPGLRSVAARAARAANGAKARTLGLVCSQPMGAEALRALAEGIVLGSYRFTKYMTGDRKPKSAVETVTIALPAGTKVGRPEREAIQLGQRIGEAVCLTRDLVSEPGNELYPERLAEQAQRLAKQYGMSCEVFDAKEIDRRGMKLLAAVGRGSARPPRFVHLRYAPKQPRGKVVLVGKGLTFDSGGLCIKPAAGMGEMKTDMAGAANVLGALAACASARVGVEVHGIIASAENMPDGNAYRPGDVFGSLSGKTVEIVNTDAEGRLVLADALTYGAKLKPDLMVDLATLTGACIVALGKTCSGYYGSDEKVADLFGSAAKAAGEQFWRLPLLDDLKEQLKSDIADLKHTGDRWGGSITAALFLKEFVESTPWVHADIAGPVWADHSAGFYNKGASGHGVLTLLALVEEIERQKK